MLSLANLLNPLSRDGSVSSADETPTRSTGFFPVAQPLLQNAPTILSTSYNVKLTRQTTLDVLCEHGANTHMEYPETREDGRIGHLFNRPDIEQWVNPTAYFAYSLGPPKGSKNDGSCDILVDRVGSRVLCRVSHFTCM